MQGLEQEIEAILELLQLEDKNCKKELASLPDGHLMCVETHGKTTFFHATSTNGSYKKPVRRTITRDSNVARQLARKRFLQQLDHHLTKEVRQLEGLLGTLNCYSYESLIKELPRAYQKLPTNYFTPMADERTVTKEGIVIPERLVRSAKAKNLTESQIEEIREIQREWAAQPYEINTKELKNRNTTTSRGLMVRSKSEASIVEKLYQYDIPFRYDQVIQIGSKRISPDFTFFSIIDGEQYWEHVGKTNDPNYIEYHMYKRKLYERLGIVPWHNYIETYDEPDGYFDIRIVETEINYKLLRRLQLQ